MLNVCVNKLIDDILWVTYIMKIYNLLLHNIQHKEIWEKHFENIQNKYSNVSLHLCTLP